ncbi:MAG TPA: class A beta-lactamase-related serine hydrolase, partial [Candidatus Poseidoniales archaeon]
MAWVAWVFEIQIQSNKPTIIIILYPCLMDMYRKAALAVFLVIMFSFGSFSSMPSVSMQDTFETQGRQALQTNFSAYHEEVKQFVETWNLPGAQLAIIYNGTIVFDESYGVQDLTTQEPVTSDSRFRIASLSKAITAAAIQTLVVRRNISLNDKVVDLIPDLVPGNLDGCAYPLHSNRFYASHIEVGHLLNHTSGLVTNLTGWHYAYDWVDTDTKPAPILNEGVNNPCIDHVTVSQEYDNGTLAPVKVETMIRETLRLPLNSQPGTVYDYSNIGYRILGEIIERQCNCTFENYVRYYVLGRMNIHDMQLGKTLIEDRAENEVTYYPVDSPRSFSHFPQLNGDINDNTETNPLVNVSFGNSSSPQSHRA